MTLYVLLALLVMLAITTAITGRDVPTNLGTLLAAIFSLTLGIEGLPGVRKRLQRWRNGQNKEHKDE